MFKKHHSLQEGFSLIEIMVFVGIFSMVFISAISYAISSLYRMKLTEHRTKALFYAEELKEWLDGEHENDWILFHAKASGQTYCVNQALELNMSISSLTSGNCGMNGVSGSTPRIFRRTVTLTSNTPTQVTAHIEITWNETSANGSITSFSQDLDAIFTSY